jgi:plasmid stabilization system protein ParE
MAFKVGFLPRAETEVNDAFLWYESKSSGLGEKFFEAVENKIKAIKQNPYQFPIGRSGFRKAIVKLYPYIILFKISGEAIIIHSVFHTHLNPNKKP